MNKENSITELDLLYGKYHHKILIYLKSICNNPDRAEDATKETFIRVHKSFDSFDPSRGSFFTWARTIAKNICTCHLHKDSRIEEDKKSNTEDIFVKNSLQNTLKKSIECLPEPERSIVYLKYRDGLTLDGIARELKISRRTVRRKYISTLDMVKETLQSQDLR